METGKTHFEIMEELGQLSIFDLPQVQQEEQEAAVGAENPLSIGDKVRCTIDVSESEAYYYLKYYYPNALTSIGEVAEVEGNTVYVRFKGDTIPLERHQVSL